MTIVVLAFLQTVRLSAGLAYRLWGLIGSAGDPFCPNEHCRDRGVRGQGTIRIHSYKEGRYRCHTCRGTFGATRGTAFYGLRTPATVVTTVLTLLSHGCPPQAIVAAFALDERTVAGWL